MTKYLYSTECDPKPSYTCQNSGNKPIWKQFFFIYNYSISAWEIC